MSPLPWFRMSNAERARSKARPRFRPAFEALEGRILLNNRFVAPAGAPVDNVTTFATLQAALTMGGLPTGDTIQIEPGSTPGNVVNADFTTFFTGVTGVTIQGDPAVEVSAIPQFTISDATTIAAPDTLNLSHVNVGLVAAGALTLSGNTTISGSTIVEVNSSASTLITFSGNTALLTKRAFRSFQQELANFF